MNAANFVLALLNFLANLVDTAGKDHIQKRMLLQRLALAASLVGVTWLAFWWCYRPDLLAARANEPRVEVEHAGPPLHQPPIRHDSPPVDSRVETPAASPTDSATEPTKPTSRGEATATHKHPTPEYIWQTIHDTAPVSRDTVSKQFIGVPVSWDCRLGSSYKKDGKTTVLVLRASNPRINVPIISCPVDIQKHSFLLQLPEKSPIHVDGVIDNCSPIEVTLKDVTVTTIGHQVALQSGHSLQ
ncbi:MAG: hypothetical protein AB7O68_19950 [Pirellulales bacterium]